MALEGDKINIRRLVDLMAIIREGGSIATLMRNELARLHLWVGSTNHPMTLGSSNKCAKHHAQTIDTSGAWDCGNG
jgi:hypothetical protein